MAGFSPSYGLLPRPGFGSNTLSQTKTALLTVNAVVIHAEENQITNLAVKEWINELKDATYNADDLLDEIATTALRG
nr:putative disease resistance rpp13-like protein 1 [Quercus suber]